MGVLNVTVDPGWECPAAPPSGCFLAVDGRSCTTENVCRDRLAIERRRMFRRLNELVAGDDTSFDWAWLADQFDSPEQLLGGGE